MLSSGLFLLSLALLALVVLAILGCVLYIAARNNASKTSTAAPRTVRLRYDSLRSSFRQAVELIEANIASRNERYNVPWVLVLSEGSDARPLPIAQSGVASTLSAESASAASVQGIGWEFFDRGIVIDLKGEYLGSPDEDNGTEKPWDEFLGLCRTYRPQRPFDSLVITVPATLLSDESADGRQELIQRAKLAHRRLWLAQNRFAMRFAVYLVISECEHIDGFSAFARALPDSMQASMLGWSSPYDLSTQYQTDHVDVAFNEMLHAVSDVGAELLSLDSQADHAQAVFMMPSRLDAMREQLRLYADELMRPSAYHEPFLLRGIYLTGDSSETLERAAALADDPQRRNGDDAAGDDWREPVFGPRAASAAAPGDADSAGAGANGTPARHDLIGQLSLQPAFLRDLFERKIFQERGLTRPSRTQQLSRPLLRRSLRWGTIAILSIWGIGMVFAAAQLHTRGGRWVMALSQLHRNDVMRNAMLQNGAQPAPDWYRATALSAMGINEGFHEVVAANVFMPGSWIDNLQARVGVRFQQAFGEATVTAVRREMMARVAQLTGTARDPSTGDLIVGADCHAPLIPANAASRPIGLAVDEQPEMTALQTYLTSVDRLESTLQALQRLGSASTSSPEDLRTVIAYTLGTQPQGDVARSLPYFYNGGPRLNLLFNNDVPVIRTAVRCTLDKGNAQLNDTLFGNNRLMRADRAVSDGLASITLSGASGTANSLTNTLDGYRKIVSGIQTESDLIAIGGGAWMRPDGPPLGQAYDRLVDRVARSGLLGQDAADRMRNDSTAGLQAFRSTFAQRFGSPDSGVRWNDKDGRFALSPDRLALQDALANLMNQPFMSATRGRSLTPPTAGTTIAWDTTQLDQAGALADSRKRYLDSGLAHVQPSVQAALQAAVDAQFVAVTMDRLASAATLVPTSSNTDADLVTFQAAQPRLLKIESFLDDMGAGAQSNIVRATVSADALQHLRAIDDALTASDLYAVAQNTRGNVASGTGQALVFDAFGVQDAASLAAYMGQQAARAQALGQQANVYLGAVSAADGNTDLAFRWQAIERDLERYKLKNPNSALLGLEQFVSGLTTKTAPGSCVDMLAGSAPSQDGNYFSAIYQRLYMQLASRCTQVQSQQGRQRWNTFATTFNHDIAGAAPFGNRPEKPADPSLVALALQRFKDAGQTISGQPTHSAYGVDTGGPAVQRFATQMRAVAAFLDPLFPSDHAGDHEAAAGYDITPTFRTNRQAETEGNQIIEWTLQSGTQVVRSGEASHSIRWTVGTPIVLTLRIAKNSPYNAMNDALQPAMDTDGHLVNYRFSDPWALLSFIQHERVIDPVLAGNARAETLQFTFPLVPATSATGGNGSGTAAAGGGTTRATGAVSNAASQDPARPSAELRARVFVQLQVSPAGKTTTLPWPGTFPNRAPGWNGARVD